MHHGQEELLIRNALVFLVAAGVIVPLMRSVKIPAVAGFILAGVALGPYGLGALADRWPALDGLTMSDPEAAAPFAELGVLFLLFLIGLELSFEKLRALRRVVFGAGSLQAGLSAAVIGLAAYAFGLDPPAAALAGLALALSSTAIVMQLLIDGRKAGTPVGRAALGVLLFQDVLVAPILIYVGFAGGDSAGGLAAVLFEALVNGLLALAVILAVGRYLLRPVFRMAAAAGGRDFLMAITLLTIVGAAAITAGAGLSIALGAFLAGLLLGETEFKHQAEVDLEPFKGLLLGLFFMTVGFGLDLSAVAANWPLVIGGVVAMIAVKAAIAWGALRLFAGGPALATQASLLLAPAGEFAFVVLSAGVLAGVIEPGPATILSAIAGLSMLLIPLTGRLGALAAERLAPDPAHQLPETSADLEGHVVIAGFGRVGRAVAGILESENTPFVALDTNPHTVARERAKGRTVYLGDGGREEILSKAGIRGAALVVVTLDDPDSAERMVRAARQLRPEAEILARAQDADHARQLVDAGATHVVPDAIEAGLQMSAWALESIGYEGETVRDLIAAERDAEYRKATAKSG